jgi:ribosome assembly protein 1
MQGAAVFLEELSVQANSNDELDMGRLTGEAIRLVREGISAGFLDWSPRIMLAMYSCEIQATSKQSTHPPPLFPFFSFLSFPHPTPFRTQS